MLKKTVSLILAFILIFTSVPNVVLASNSNDGHLILLEQLLEEIRQEALFSEQEIAQADTYVFGEEVAQALEEAERLMAEIEAITVAVNAAAFGSDFVPMAPFSFMPLSAPWEGEGTREEPFLIQTMNDLVLLSENHMDFNNNNYFRLVNSITFNTSTTWQPIGDSVNPFMGNFDGGNNTISGLRNTGAADYFGLFGRTHGARISNLTLANVDIAVREHSGALVGFAEETTINNVAVRGSLSVQGLRNGGVVGVLTNNSTVNNSRFTGTINSTSTPGTGVIGGIAGTVTNNSVINNATVVSLGIEITGSTIGGIAGSILTNSSVTNSDFEGLVTGTSMTGGIIGASSDAMSIRGNRVWGTVTGSSSVGGVIGFAGVTPAGIGTGRELRSNLNRATVSGTTQVGGIIGMKGRTGTGNNGIWVMENANHGNISANQIVGGLIGQSTGPVTIANSYNTGDVAATVTNIAGGIVGQISVLWPTDAHIIRTYNAGVITTVTGFPGAIAGINNGTITNTWMLVRNVADRAIGTMPGIFIGTLRLNWEQMITLNNNIAPPFDFDTFENNIGIFNNGFPILMSIDYTPRRDDDIDPTGRRITGYFYFPTGNASIVGRDFSARFFWDEDYFAQPASEFNYSLATMSLSFAMSAFGSNIGGMSAYENKARNAISLLSRLGFEDIDTNEYFRQKPGMDTVGVIAGHREIYVNGNTYTLIAVSTRGQGYEAEWAGNLTIGASGYHEGFYRAATEVYRFLIEDYIDVYGSNFQNDVKLWIVGFSRGAAPANLVASWITRDEGITGIDIEPDNIFAYTFATPRPTPLPREYRNIHNTINLADIVTHVAPERWGFQRHGYENRELPERYHLYDPAAYESMLNFFVGLDTPATASSITYVRGQRRHIVEAFVAREFLTVPVLGQTPVPIRDRETLMSTFIEGMSYSVFGGLGYRSIYTEYEQLIRAIIAGRQSESPIAERRPWTSAIDSFTGYIFEDYHWISLLALEANPLNQFNLSEHLADVFSASIAHEGIDIYEYVDMLPEAIHYVLSSLLSALWAMGSDDIATLWHNFDILAPAHYAELYLAWMMSQDENFGGTPFDFIAAIRIVRVNSDVDVRVYSTANGKLMAEIINGESQNVSHLIASVNAAGEKILYLPADGSFDMVLTATGDGTISVSIGEHSHAIGRLARVTSWFDVPVETGDVLNVALPRFSAEDAANITSGSDVSYVLRDGVVIVPPDREVSGEEAVQEARHTVNIESANPELGMVMGGGSYVEGFLSQVMAIPFEGNEFVGWYINDELVSQENVYRFRVLGDTKLIARFAPAPDDGLRIYVSNHVELMAAVASAPINGELLSIVATQSFDAQPGNQIIIPTGANTVLASQPGSVFTYTQTNLNRRHFMVNGTLTLENIILCGDEGLAHNRGGAE
ncbi:MAG: hypothetical protein FWE24_08825, partial [Defluviitaleaceae bacterium]|nr:hypothetical protein [Defluviitaleaceae bacterium]